MEGKSEEHSSEEKEKSPNPDKKRRGSLFERTTSKLFGKKEKKEKDKSSTPSTSRFSLRKSSCKETYDITS